MLRISFGVALIENRPRPRPVLNGSAALTTRPPEPYPSGFKRLMCALRPKLTFANPLMAALAFRSSPEELSVRSNLPPTNNWLKNASWAPASTMMVFAGIETVWPAVTAPVVVLTEKPVKDFGVGSFVVLISNWKCALFRREARQCVGGAQAGVEQAVEARVRAGLEVEGTADARRAERAERQVGRRGQRQAVLVHEEVERAVDVEGADVPGRPSRGRGRTCRPRARCR